MIFSKNEKVDRKKLKEVLAYLETKPVIEFNPRESYPAEVWDATGFLTSDTDYLAHKEKIDEKKVEPEEMSPEEIRTMLTWFARGERFCDGFLAGEVNDGTVLRVLRRLDELTEPNQRG